LCPYDLGVDGKFISEGLREVNLITNFPVIRIKNRVLLFSVNFIAMDIYETGQSLLNLNLPEDVYKVKNDVHIV
jgi:hypothetical protein